MGASKMHVPQPLVTSTAHSLAIPPSFHRAWCAMLMFSDPATARMNAFSVLPDGSLRRASARSSPAKITIRWLKLRPASRR